MVGSQQKRDFCFEACCRDTKKSTSGRCVPLAQTGASRGWAKEARREAGERTNAQWQGFEGEISVWMKEKQETTFAHKYQRSYVQHTQGL